MMGMDAPERLFLDSESQVYRVAGRKLKDSNIEYIRADLVHPPERHQRLVEAAKGALELILGAPGIICRPDLCETCARCQTRDGNDCLLVTNLKAALEGEISHDKR